MDADNMDSARCEASRTFMTKKKGMSERPNK
jgi:hypothetical protein